MIPSLYEVVMAAAVALCLVAAFRARSRSRTTAAYMAELAALLQSQQRASELLLSRSIEQRQRIEQLEGSNK